MFLQKQSKVLCLLGVGVQCLAQGHFSGGNFNVPVRRHELATFRYQDRSPNRSATAATTAATGNENGAHNTFGNIQIVPLRTRSVLADLEENNRSQSQSPARSIPSEDS